MYSLLVSVALWGPQLGPATLELRALKKADQAVRQFTLPPSMEAIHAMERGDFAREERIRQLLREDKVVTGEDLDNAALILQHGSDPDDYMLARELSILAFTKGNRGTLQTAAEDRYLLSIGRKQRFGNQFGYGEGGKLEFRDLDEDPPAAVTDAFRAEFLIPPASLMREKGLGAIGQEIPRLVERWQKRTVPAWIVQMDARSVSRELNSLAQRAIGRDFDYRLAERTLTIYAAGGLATPRNFHHAAVVLACSSDARHLLLANELAALAVSRGRKEARRTFIETWDKFLVVIGKSDRYGTISGAYRVSPVVAREFGLVAWQTSQMKPPHFHGRYRYGKMSLSGRDS